MLGNGRVVFGVWTGQMNTIETSAAFNDNAWHHVVATQSSSGMKLYIDGVLQGTNHRAKAQPAGRVLAGRRRQHVGRRTTTSTV